MTAARLFFSCIAVFFALAFGQATLAGEPERSAGAGLSLADCYRLALKQSEVIAINAELIKESEARFIQAFSGLLPHVSFSSTDTRYFSRDAGTVKTYERRFVFKQTLFSGFKEFAGMKGTKLEHEQRINEKIRAEQLLFTDVSDAYFLLIEERKDVQMLQRTAGALASRISELRDRERLGRSRRSEVVTTQAQFYGVQAELESVKAQEEIARQLLEFLIGRPITTIADPGNAMPPLNPEIFYTSRVAHRPDVQAAEQAFGVAKSQVAIARADFFPTLSLEGHHYLGRNTVSAHNSRWDVGISIDVPIFEGGRTYGQYKQAQSRARQAQLQSGLTQRSALTEVRNAYAHYRSDAQSYRLQRKALAASELNFFLQKQDYKHNLVNNLDVLTAIQSLEEARRNYFHSLYEAKRRFWQLRLAAGEIPLEN